MSQTFNMLPGGETGTNQWLEPTEPGACGASDIDNDNGDTQYCYESTHSHEVTFTIADPGVAEVDIGSITSVKVKFKAKHTGAGSSYVDVYQTGTGISNGSTRVEVTDTSDYGLYATDAETTYDGSNAWTYAKLEDIQIKLDKFRNPLSGELRISYLYVEVTYVPPPSINKFQISGNLTLKGGGSFIIK